MIFGGGGRPCHGHCSLLCHWKCTISILEILLMAKLSPRWFQPHTLLPWCRKRRLRQHPIIGLSFLDQIHEKKQEQDWKLKHPHSRFIKSPFEPDRHVCNDSVSSRWYATVFDDFVTKSDRYRIVKTVWLYFYKVIFNNCFFFYNYPSVIPLLKPRTVPVHRRSLCGRMVA